MKTKEKSLRELLADIQKASELERYDPAADLALLAAQYRKMSRWDFGKLLDGMAAKYQNEWSAIHAALAEKARAEAGDEAAMLFETHQMMAEDLDYEEAISDHINNEKMNAEAAISDTAVQFAAMFESMDDSYMQARAADVRDVSDRILGILSGAVQGGIASDVPVLLDVPPQAARPRAITQASAMAVIFFIFITLLLLCFSVTFFPNWV